MHSSDPTRFNERCPQPENSPSLMTGRLDCSRMLRGGAEAQRTLSGLPAISVVRIR